MTARMTVAQLRAGFVLGRNGRARPIGGNPTNKYGAKKTAYTSPLNGPRVYSSKAEAARAAYLDGLIAEGSIRYWWPQPRFFIGLTPEGKPLHYTCDFGIVTSDGQVTYEEVKGRPSRDYVLRRTMLKDRWGIVPTEVRR